MEEKEEKGEATTSKDASDSEDESEILEESPCGRWQKRREEVRQRDVPGIDAAYLAMDTEEGVEVVWNETQFSDRRRNIKEQEKMIRQIFENLIGLDHPNIVKFHKYWTEMAEATMEKPRVIFITEYMSSGSLRSFLRKTKMNKKSLPEKTWKLWCTQILTALSYLHACDPPIIHGNLACDTIFIQHNGLVKIGSVAPEAIDHHVKTCREKKKNMHYIAPEYAGNEEPSPAADIYSFGVCALVMSVLELSECNFVSEDDMQASVDKIENASQRDFIRKCLSLNPQSRPSARDLLFHPVLFEVHSLKLLASHAINSICKETTDVATHADCVYKRYLDGTQSSGILAEIKFEDGEDQTVLFKDTPAMDVERLLEDVRNGVFPLTAFYHSKLPSTSGDDEGFESFDQLNQRGRTLSSGDGAKLVVEETKEQQKFEAETRTIKQMSCSIKQEKRGSDMWTLTLLLRLSDHMNRQLSCDFTDGDTASQLTNELVDLAFIAEEDREKISSFVEQNLIMRFPNRSSNSSLTE